MVNINYAAAEYIYCIIAFSNTSAAMEAQSLLKKNGITAAVMPTPRSVQASCGLAVRVSIDDCKRTAGIIKNSLDENTYDFYKAYKKNGHTEFIRI